MILRVLQILTFILTATIQVRVHAHEIVSLSPDQQPIEEPANCLESGETCALKTNSGKKLQLEFSDAKVTLGSLASAIRTQTNQMKLINGTALITTPNLFTVETEFGKVIVKSGEVVLVKEEKKVVARVHSGEVFIQPRGKMEMFQIEPGLENSLSPVDQTGVAHTGFSTPINLAEHALLWSSLYSGPKTNFTKEFKSFAKVWRKATSQAVALHQDLAKRRIASLEEDYQKRQAALKKRQAYESQLRALFRKKSLDQ